MDALGLSAPRPNTTCSSVEDLQSQLHQLLAAKTTDTRAEHVSPSFELLSHTAFQIPADTENSATDNPDPDQNPAQSQQVPITRTIIASETVQNQPVDDPILQKAVAKHISNAIGAVDSSAWTVRQVTRGAQGWRFTYICKDSLQAWNRANAKNPDRPVIASHSGSGGFDPINLSRPAFDCRGTLTIAFSKSSRSIIAKYEHTPLHKTVTQLVERLVPTPIPVRSSNQSSQRTPKARCPRPADREEGSTKKKTPRAKPPLVDGEESARKRTPKAKRPPPVEGEDGGSSKRRRKTGKASGTSIGGLEGGQNTSQAQTHPNSAVERPGPTGFLNVPPAEAERRRQTAIELLSGKGIDPTTLSPEQFNIFANQAPNLQSASLEMLAKYGAERLRIVHPDEKEQAGPSNPTPATGQAADASAGKATSETLTGSTNTPTRKPRSRKRKSDGPPTEVSIGNGAVVPLEQDGELGTTESALKPRVARARKTRGRCDTCRQRKVACTKEHPNCSVCIDAGVDCVYLPPKPRRKSEKSAETVEQNDSDRPEENDRVQHEAENTRRMSIPGPSELQTLVPPQPPPDIENEEFIPDPNILSGPVEHQAVASESVNTSNYYRNSHNGIGFQQTSSAQAAAGGTTSIPTFTYPQSQINEDVAQPARPVTFPPTSTQPQQVHGLPDLESLAAPAPPQKKQSASSSHRKSLPTSQSKQTPVPPPTIPTHTPSWGSSPSIHHSTSASPKTAHQPAAKRSRPRKSRPEPEKQGYESLNQGTPQPTQFQSPMTRSPYQSAAHVHPRQSRNSQSNTPVATNSRPPPQAPPTTSHQPTTSTSSYSSPTISSSIPNYDSYPRYDNTRNEQYTDAGHDQSSTRTTYESSSYQNNTTTTTTAPSSYSSAPSYDYGRTSGAVNPLSQALNGTPAYTGTTNSTTNQWPTSQTRGAQPNSSSSTYSLPASNTSAPHGYSTRASDSRASSQNASYNQSQPHNYTSYSSQPPSLNQPGQQSWYGFTAANSTNQANYANNRQNTHGNHRSAAPTYSSQYGGNDEQAIYDLLRTGSSNH
ncbi:hypothetical protein ANO14919_076830 [Xylariales sp. No.14919]|nr:hypothetical protein ANO14919_076830 [Xylariales sp. No.14919]